MTFLSAQEVQLRRSISRWLSRNDSPGARSRLANSLGVRAGATSGICLLTVLSLQEFGLFVRVEPREKIERFTCLDGAQKAELVGDNLILTELAGLGRPLEDRAKLINRYGLELGHVVVFALPNQARGHYS